MSMSLLKKSMAIVEEGLEANRKPKEKQIESKKKVIRKPNRRSNEILPKNNARKKTVEEIRKEIEEESHRADDNIRKLLSLSRHTVKIPNAEKILQRVHRGKYVVEEKKPVEQESIFTEEDFIAFEKELAQNL